MKTMRFNKLPKILAATIAVFLCCTPAGFGGTPEGYDWILKHHGGAHLDTVSDPAVVPRYAAKWAQDWSGPLGFFTTEIDSGDASRVKAGILCLSFLAGCIDHEGRGQVSTESKEKFAKAFPVSKIKGLLAAHPEYAEWAFPLQKTHFAGEIKLPKPAVPKP
jgi:hypothetical protein